MQIEMYRLKETSFLSSEQAITFGQKGPSPLLDQKELPPLLDPKEP